MNNLQKTASAISGYEPNSPFSSANDVYYYDLETKEARIEQIKDYGLNVLGVELTELEAERVHDWLEIEGELTQNERFFSFSELK